MTVRDPSYYTVCGCLHVHTLTLIVSFFLLVVNTLGLISVGFSREYYLSAPFVLSYIAIVLFFLGNRLKKHQLYIPYVVLSLISLVAACVMIVLIILKLTGNEVHVQMPTELGKPYTGAADTPERKANFGSLAVTVFYCAFHAWYFLHVLIRDYRYVRDEC